MQNLIRKTSFYRIDISSTLTLSCDNEDKFIIEIKEHDANYKYKRGGIFSTDKDGLDAIINVLLEIKEELS